MAQSVNERIRLTISSPGAAPLVADVTLPVEFGRVDPTQAVAEVLFQPAARPEGTRIAVAPAMEVGVSRRQAWLAAAGRGLRLKNISGSIGIARPGEPDLPPGGEVEIQSAGSFAIGRVLVQIGFPEDKPRVAAAENLRSLASPVIAPTGVPQPPVGGGDALPARESPELHGFVRWWQRVISVLQSATSSSEFFRQAADALVDLVGLDLGAVLLRSGTGWEEVSVAGRAAGCSRPSTRVLGRVVAERRTFWSVAGQSIDAFSSLAVLDSYVAAPILDPRGEVLGVLYGHRMGDPGLGTGISELEALLVETLACGVAAGLARMEQEEAAVRQRVTFGQFFSPQLAVRLESEPDLLRGRDAEITVMFCDIRGFSAVSERLGPAATMDWIGDVLSVLSERVVAAGGVLVDYVGDELLAMWGAPTSQPDHAQLACTAARAMLGASGELDERWADVVGGPMRFGIGINSSVARVGNTGSTRKFKYGPLGNGVNLASRVQGATKFLRVDALITGSTRALLDDSFRVRRLCMAQVLNIQEPLELFELDAGTDARAGELFPAYEEALAAFEAGDFSRSTRLLGAIADAFPGDGPTLVLLSRAVQAMVTDDAAFSPVWTVPGK